MNDHEREAAMCDGEDRLLRDLGLDPDSFRTEAGFVNTYKVRAAIRSPQDYAGQLLNFPEPSP